MKNRLARRQLRRHDGPKHSLGTAFHTEKTGRAAAGAPSIMARPLEQDTTSSALVGNAVRLPGRSKERVGAWLVTKRQPASKRHNGGRLGKVPHAGVPGVFQGMPAVSKRYRHNPAPNAPVHGAGLTAPYGVGGSGRGERTVYAKLCTALDGGALIKAYKGLAKINGRELSASLVAEVERPLKGDPDTFERLVGAVREQEEAHCRIGAVFEESARSDSYPDGLARIHDPGSLDMAVDVVTIKSLCGLVQESYKGAK